MSWFSDLFKRKDKTTESYTPIDTRLEEQKAVDSALSKFITQYLPNFKPGEPYQGDLSAPMSGYESQGMQYLQKFLSGPDYTGLLPLAGDEVAKTLTGDYDPYTSKFYQAAREGAMIENQEAKDRLNRETASRNKYFSSERIRGMGDIETKTSNYLNNILAGLSENERARRLQVLPEARAINKELINAPLAKVAAGTTFGALPRELEQADYERAYQEWARQQAEKKLPLAAAQGFKTQDPTYVPTVYQPSSFERYVQPMLQEAIKVAMMVAMA